MFVDLYITKTTAGHPLMAKKNMENKTGHANGHAHVLKLTAMVSPLAKVLVCCAFIIKRVLQCFFYGFK
jgi:hypothetical protein